jgi:formiminotetrahydrofolate cyclodeaminase
LDDNAALVARTVREFVASVASTDEPVPAGGSVAALTGASSAALLALVCGVEGLSVMLVRAQALQQRLLALVDEDAEAFRAYLRVKRSPGAVDPITRTPLAIAAACADVVTLSHAVESRTRRTLLSDVRTARYLANGALAGALETAEQNVSLHTDPEQRARLRDEIAHLRS